MRQRVDCLLIASGKGGVGTSVIASLTALAAAERGDRVLLVDASEAGGTLHHLFGVRPTHSLWMLSDRYADPSQALLAVDERLTLVAGGTSGSATAPTNDHERRSALARLAHLYPGYDTIVFDGGSRLDTIAAISELADPTLMLVTSADRLALAANYALVKSVNSRRDNAPISVVANRHGESLAEEACEFLIGACSHFLGRTIDVAGVVPDDPCLQAAVGAGMTVRDALEGSPAADAVRGILNRVVPSTQAPLPGVVAMSGSSSSFRRWS
jgi:MinD-like ATPase involved in chromosome partitioning or flagellar assembly